MAISTSLTCTELFHVGCGWELRKGAVRSRELYNEKGSPGHSKEINGNGQAGFS